MKVRSTIDEEEVTVWLPLDGRPVVSLSVVDETTKCLLWTVMHESFRKAATNTDGSIELSITRLVRAAADGTADRGVEDIPLHYGVTPPGMHQTAPSGSKPPALQQGMQYLAVVRENVEDGLRWFEFKPIPATR